MPGPLARPPGGPGRRRRRPRHPRPGTRIPWPLRVRPRCLAIAAGQVASCVRSGRRCSGGAAAIGVEAVAPPGWVSTRGLSDGASRAGVWLRAQGNADARAQPYVFNPRPTFADTAGTLTWQQHRLQLRHRLQAAVSEESRGVNIASSRAADLESYEVGEGGLALFEPRGGVLDGTELSAFFKQILRTPGSPGARDQRQAGLQHFDFPYLMMT